MKQTLMYMDTEAPYRTDSPLEVVQRNLSDTNRNIYIVELSNGSKLIVRPNLIPTIILSEVGE